MGKYGNNRHGGGGFDDWAPPGSVIYKDVNGRWHALVPGTAGYVLKTNGPTVPPTWAPVVVGSGGSAHIIQDEGVPLTQRTGLDIRGNGVAATDDAANDKTIITVPGYSNFVASGSGHTNGLVPDPGAVAGTTKFLREDSTWQAPSVASAGHTIVDETTSLTARSKLAFQGAGVAATDDSGNDQTIVTIPGGTTGHIIVDETTPLTSRANLAFKGAGVTATDNAGSGSTDVTVPGYTTFVSSGVSHAGGLVPDPGATGGTTKFLREDATWQVPSSGGGGIGLSDLILLAGGC